MRRLTLVFLAAAAVLPVSVFAQTKSAATKSATTKPKVLKKRPDYPPHSVVLKDFKKVVTAGDTTRSLYTLYVRDKDQQMYAELPSSFATKKYFIALTVSSGERFAGLQTGDMVMYWRRYNNRLAMIIPQTSVTSNGDPESKASVKRLFTDQVILEVPIVTMGPSGGPVIDFDALLVGKSYKFFGTSVRNAEFARLIKIKKKKAFKSNIEVAFEVPTSRGKLQTLHYSISEIPMKGTYKPRKADARIGYFTTAYSDLGQYKDDKTVIRYVNRWHLEKRDPKLKISPAKNPIIFYIEHTTPVRYRRWVREGLLVWNKAFEKVGISDAIEVHYQDAVTGAHMEKDPEDVRYNFVRWLNNDVGTAIGPSRVHPQTGQILDADIILTDGWVRHFRFQFEDLIPSVAMEGFSAETLAWLAKHPNWDPRVRLAPPAHREFVIQQIRARGAQPFAGHPLFENKTAMLGDDPFDGLIGRVSQVNGQCLASTGKAFDLALMRMSLDLLTLDDDKKDEKKDDKKKEDDKKKDDKKKPKKDLKSLVDGMPEDFVGPLLANLVAHEVGHTLGLRHNFKASAIYDLAKINSKEIKGKKPNAGSVMDYTPVNIRMKAGKVQGDFTMRDIGPYDMWAIEYGYSFAKDLKPILQRVADPALAYATDEDTSGPDPLARRYDFSANPLDYANDQMKLARYHRGRLLTHFVKDGDSWAKARRGYELTLGMQTKAISMMGNWIGGVHVNRDKKGDKNGRKPLVVVSAETQRKALKFVIENAFRDEAFGINSKILSHMSVDKWLDVRGNRFSTSNWPIHDRIMGVQASALTMIMNPTTLRRVYDNEFQVPADQDALTLAEMVQSLTDEIWKEAVAAKKKFTARKPMISSFRRNLQREHVERLIDLSLPGAGTNEVFKPLSNLVLSQLRAIHAKADKLKDDANADPYTRAHFGEIAVQVKKALDSQYIYNANAISGGGSGGFFFFRPEEKKKN